MYTCVYTTYWVWPCQCELVPRSDHLGLGRDVGACPWTKAVSAAREPVALHLGVGLCGFALVTLARQLFVLIMLDLFK